MARIGLVDDHPLYLDGVRHFLATKGHEVVVAVQTADAALQALAERAVDVLLLDVNMKEGGAFDILPRLREAGFSAPIILLTAHIEPAQLLDAVALDVKGLLLKESAPEALLDCIERVVQGGTDFDPRVMEQALRHRAVPPRTLSEEPLTAREREIVALIRQGLRNKVIADRCGVSEGTVKVHLHSIFRKLGVRSRAELIVASQQFKQAS